MIIAIAGMPSLVAADPAMASAWEDGRDDADKAYGHAETYRELFSLEPTYVPVSHRDGDDREAAYRDGYAVRAQDLTDGSAQG